MIQHQSIFDRLINDYLILMKDNTCIFLFLCVPVFQLGFRHCYSECKPRTIQVLGWVLVLNGFTCTNIYNITIRLRNIWSILINVILAFFKEQNTENKMYMNCPYLVTVLGRSSSSRVKAICPLCIKKAKHVLPETRIFQKQLRPPAFHFFLVGQNYTDNII